jgi:hypothetical protein
MHIAASHREEVRGSHAKGGFLLPSPTSAPNGSTANGHPGVLTGVAFVVWVTAVWGY